MFLVSAASSFATSSPKQYSSLGAHTGTRDDGCFAKARDVATPGKKYSVRGEMTNPFSSSSSQYVFVCASRNEGFSNALIEAMGCGSAMRRDPLGAMLRRYRKGKSGYLVPAKILWRWRIVFSGSSGPSDGPAKWARPPGETVKARFQYRAMMIGSWGSTRVTWPKNV